MKAKSIRGISLKQVLPEVKDILDRGRQRDDFMPNVAIAFISIKQDWKELCRQMSSLALEVIGATSSGEFTNQGQTEGGIAILLLELPGASYQILFEAIGLRSPGEAARQLALRAKQVFQKPAFIFCCTLMTADGKLLDGETLIRSIEQEMGPELTLFGGMAGDDITFTGTYVFTGDQFTDYGMVALVLDDTRISLRGLAVSGWKPIGIVRKATRTKGNLLYEIDGQPALDIYLRFLGMDKSYADDPLQFFDSIGVHYPLQIEREGREPMMCAPISYDKTEGALVCESEIPEGARFRFSTPPDFDIVQQVVDSAAGIRQQSGEQADALLIFSCAGRLSALGPMAREENEGLAGIWNVPMAGFYTYGEFGTGFNGKHEFHSTTNSWVALKEKK